VAFYYGSGKAIPGFDEATPLRDALDGAGYNFLNALGLLLIAIATLLPWVALAALFYWLYRRGRRRWGWGRGSEPGMDGPDA
jgi:hypothetical protein